jgi:hypothetical protein
MPLDKSQEVGASGLNYGVGGEVTEELHPNLTGRKALEVYRAMKDNDALVGAILFAIEMLLRQVEWSVEKGDAKEKDAKFLEECMEDMSHSWSDFISEVLSMLPYGFAFHEIVYKKRSGPQKEGSDIPSSRFTDGKFGWRKMPLRAQESLDRWEFDDNGGIKAFVQRPAPTYEEKPIAMLKGLLFRTSVYKNNPEGRSLLRSAYTSWYYKKRIQTIEGTGIERDLAGFPVIWLPAQYMAEDAGEAEKRVVQSFKAMAENIRRDKQEALLMPLAYDEAGNKVYDIELMNAGGSRSFDTSAIIQRYNQEIAMTVLADFILLGHEKVGSFALSDDKTDLFAVALGTIMDGIADVLNRFAVPRLFALNGMDTKRLPKIVPGDIAEPDVAKLGQYVSALVNAGVPLFPDEDLEAYLRQAANLPEKSEEAKKAQELAEQQKQEQAQQFQDGAAEEGGAGGDDGSGGEGGTGQPEPEAA